MTKRIKHIRLWGFALMSSCACAGLATLSPLVATCLFTLCAGITGLAFERTRRAHWEQAVDFKFQTVQKKHNTLAQEVINTRDTVNDLRDDVHKTKISTAATHALAKNARKKPVSYKDLLATSKSTASKPTAPQQSTAQSPLSNKPAINDTTIEKLITQAIHNRDIDVFLQPVVTLPNRQTSHYEAFSRIRVKPDLSLPAARYIDIAKAKGWMQDIDALLLSQSLHIIQDAQKNGHTNTAFFVNITPHSLQDKRFITNLLSFLKRQPALALALIFEIKQSDFNALPIPALKIISALTKLGCRFSLDHVQNIHKLNEDINDLKRLRIQYIKISAAALHKATQNQASLEIAKDFKQKLALNNIHLICEKTETQAALSTALALGIKFGQGFLFGKPKAHQTSPWTNDKSAKPTPKAKTA